MNKRFAAIAALVAGVAVAGLPAAVGVPAASAKSGGHVKLSVLPLPKSSLGSAAKSLSLQHDSGANGGSGLLPVTPNRSFIPTGPPPLFNLGRIGRISGYALDYGLGARGGSGVTEVWTSVDRYKTSADAKKGLAFLHRDDRRVTFWNHHGGLAIAIKAESVAPVGSRQFAFLVSYRAANIAPLFGFDEQFTQGGYEADVTVWADRAGAAEKLAPKLARKLEARIKSALAGRLHAKPVKLPAGRKADPPPGGPDLSPLGLTPTDLGGQASDWEHLYGDVAVGSALSYYLVVMVLPGPLWGFFQNIEWFATANEASFTADFFAAFFGDAPSVDLSSVGDGAEGALANGSSGGDADVVFSSGRLLELVSLSSNSAIATSDVQNIAQTVANKINSAGLGSRREDIG
jgi:hypothetical protein